LLFLGAGGIFFLLVGLRLLYSQSSEQVEFIQDAQKSPSSKSEIVVDIAGAVEKPGVYKLSSNSRVKEALLSAGGLSSDADRVWVAKNLNLASKLNDGVKIYIPTEGELNYPVSQLDMPALGINTTKSIVNINTASKAELDTLPGVGKVTIAKIISHRPYQSVDELLNKKIVNQSTFDKIKDSISLY
jgi:competence protein ComEA